MMPTDKIIRVSSEPVWEKITPQVLAALAIPTAEPKPRRKRDYSQDHRDRIRKRRARA